MWGMSMRSCRPRVGSALVLALALAGCTASGGVSVPGADAAAGADAAPGADAGVAEADAGRRPCSPGTLACFGEGRSGATTYFDVEVALDPSAPQDFMDRIAVCGVTVQDRDGQTIAEESLRCPKCSVRSHSLGRFEWATDRSGAFRFEVWVNDIANDPNRRLGRGVSAPYSSVGDATVKGAVLVQLSPNWLEIGANGGICPL